MLVFLVPPAVCLLAVNILLFLRHFVTPRTSYSGLWLDHCMHYKCLYVCITVPVSMLDILVIFVDYQKQLIADSPDYENTRGTIWHAVCIH